jgi:aryl-alcohol dehydrogenase-like predicted oxidoreductase
MQLRSLSPRNNDAPMTPVVGMGTAGTLDTDDLVNARRVVEAALDAGSSLFDSSPMYGRAERVLGTCLAERRAEATVATKVWTAVDEEAERQLDASLAYAGGHIELIQIHNMVAWPTRLDQLEARRAAGQIDFIGATHWKVDGFADVVEAMRTGRVDAIQVPYNPSERDVEQRILPLAVDLGLGVLVMRPFANADLLRTEVPAGELDSLVDTGIRTVAQALLAWAISHPAITAAIPATSRPSRAAENAAAGEMAPLDDDQRARIAGWFTV